MKHILRNWLKPTVFRTLTHPGVNALATRLYQRSPRLFNRLLGRSPFPYVGTLTWNYQEGKSLKMYSDGKDSIVSSLYSAHQNPASHLELDEIQCWLQCHPNDNSPFYVMDIGANTGLYSLLSALSAPEVQVIAFEPLPRIQAYLQRNLRLNGIRQQVQIRSEAASDHNGTGSFYAVRSLTLPVSSSENGDFRRGKAPTEAIQIQFCKIDDLWPQLHWPRVDLIKIDTESTEPQVIRGMLNLIARHQPIIFCEILTKACAQAIEELLTPLNYRYGRIHSASLPELHTAIPFQRPERNYLLMPQRLTT